MIKNLILIMSMFFSSYVCAFANLSVNDTSQLNNAILWNIPEETEICVWPTCEDDW